MQGERIRSTAALEFKGRIQPRCWCGARPTGGI